MHASHRVTGIVAGSIFLGFTGAIPAHAEGSRSTYISDWHVNTESKRWTDSNRDNVRTSVQFSGCSTDSADGFNSAGLTLYKDVFGPDENHGTRNNSCNTSSWGDESKGDYYFTLSGVSAGATLHVNKVVIRY
jgi:hypothetical protein